MISPAKLNMLRRTRVKIHKALAQAGLLSAELVLVFVACLISLVIFSWMVKKVIINKQDEFDFAVFQWMETYINPINTSLMQGITFLGTHTFLIPANLLLTAYFLFIRKHRWYSIKVASIALSSTAMMFLLKNFFSRERPLIPLLRPAMGYSFPSGHSMMSFAFYGLLIYLTYKYMKRPALKVATIILLLLLIFLIGISRIYLRVHYASDVLAGFSVGIIWLVFSIGLLNRLEYYSKRNLQEVVEE
ncbi:MAG: phosphatase PAP2 family protein [Sphingobacteriales bacterium]|nr:MAG: phosphatase PAP2 family protein [Sphingobacteriales bacterium]